MTRPREARDSPDTRDRLLAAAAELFAEHGFRGTAVRDIAERAGANVAAANYHFGSKRGLYLAVLRAEFARVNRRLEERGARLPERGRPPRDRARLEAILRSRIATMAEELVGSPPSRHAQLMLREMVDPSEAQPEIVEEFFRPQVDQAVRILSLLQPGLDRVELERCVFSIIGQILFYQLARAPILLMLGEDRYPGDVAQRLADHVCALMLGGMERLATNRGRRHRRAG